MTPPPLSTFYLIRVLGKKKKKNVASKVSHLYLTAIYAVFVLYELVIFRVGGVDKNAPGTTYTCGAPMFSGPSVRGAIANVKPAENGAPPPTFNVAGPAKYYRRGVFFPPERLGRFRFISHRRLTRSDRIENRVAFFFFPTIEYPGPPRRCRCLISLGGRASSWAAARASHVVTIEIGRFTSYRGGGGSGARGGNAINVAPPYGRNTSSAAAYNNTTRDPFVRGERNAGDNVTTNMRAPRRRRLGRYFFRRRRVIFDIKKKSKIK